MFSIIDFAFGFLGASNTKSFSQGVKCVKATSSLKTVKHAPKRGREFVKYVNVSTPPRKRRNGP